MLSCAAFSRALGRSTRLTRLPLRNLHSISPQLPFSRSHWTEPTGNGLVPIVVEQTVCGWCTHCTPVNLLASLLLTLHALREEANDHMTSFLVSFASA